MTTGGSGDALPLENLELWLRADAGITLTGNSVTEWTDQSGKAFSVTQTQTSKQPTYVTDGFQNGPSVRFTGGKLLAHSTSNVLASGSARTFVVAGKADAAGTGGTLVAVRRSTPLYWFLLGTFYGYHHTYTDGVTGANNAYGPSDLVSRITVPFLAVQKTGGAGTKVGTSLSGNALPVTQGGSFAAETGSAGLTVGGTEVTSGHDWRGDIAEVLVFSRELSASELLVLERYLNRKHLVVPIPSVTNLVAQILSESQAFISWQNTGVITNTVLTLERKTGSAGDYEVIAALTNKSHFIDTNLTAGSTYYYRVKAAHAYSGESPYSNEGSVTTPFARAGWPLESLNVWLRGDQAGLSPVGQWDDLSGKGNHANQSTSTYRPSVVTNVANAQPALQFDGSNDTLEIATSPATNTFTVLAVARTALSHEIDTELNSGWPGNSGQRYLLSCIPYGSIDPGLNYTNAGANLSVGTNGMSYYSFERVQIGTDGNFAAGVYEGAVGSGFNLIECSMSNRVASLLLNGNLERVGLQSQRTTVLAPAQIGGYTYGYFQGEIAEVMIFDKVLSLEEKRSIYLYLNNRYALATNSLTAPAGLSATVVSPAQISLVWTNSGAGNANVQIERKTGSDSLFQIVATVPAESTSFLDRSLNSGTEYSYRLRGERLGDYSDYSSEVVASTLSSGSSIPLTAITLWLRADGASGKNPSAHVNKWLDESARTTHAIQTGGTQQPMWVENVINGRPALRFDGTNDMLRLVTSPGTNEFSVFVVARPEAVHEIDVELSSSGNPAYSGQRYIVACGGDYETINSFLVYGTGGAALSVGTNGLSFYQFEQDSLYGQISAAYAVQERPIEVETSLFSFEVGGRSASVYMRGVSRRRSTGTLRSTIFAPVHIGGFAATSDGYHKGDIAEILIFGKLLSDGERRSVERYLATKYGLISGVPAAPTGLVAESISQSQISLTWSSSATNAGATYLERKTGSGGAFAVIATCDPRTTSYLDAGLNPGSEYFYRVRMENWGGYSSYSSEANATTRNSGEAIPISDAVLWLKGDGLVEMNSSGAVTRWADVSGHTNDAVQTTPAIQPQLIANQLNGRPVVRFDGANDYFAVPNLLNGATAAEAFVILKSDVESGSAKGFWKWGSQASGTVGYPTSSGAIGEDFASTTFRNLGDPSTPIAQFNIYNVLSGTNQWAARLNGVLIFSSGTNTFGVYSEELRIGNSVSHYFDGDVAEMIVFTKVLSPGERDAVMVYLNEKYDVISLPTGTIALNGQALSSSQIALSWAQANATVPALYSYTIERAQGTNAFEAIVQLSGSTHYIDSGLPAGATYKYRVRNSFAPSADPSNEILITTTPAAWSLFPVSSVALWLRGQDLQLTNEAAVESWPDYLSDGTLVATQSISSLRPSLATNGIGSEKAVVFSDGNFLELPSVLSSATEAEVFVVLQSETNTPAANQGLWRFNTNGATFYPSTGGAIQDAFGLTAAQSVLGPFGEFTEPAIYNVAAGANLWRARINGPVKQLLSTNTVAFNGVPWLGRSTGGSNEPFGGRIAQLIVFNRVLTLEEQKTVRDGLAQTYSIPLQYPAIPGSLAVAKTNTVNSILTWTALTGSENGLESYFVLDRQADTNLAFIPLSQLVRTAASYLDAYALPEVVYWYRMRAINDVGETISSALSVGLPDYDEDTLSDYLEDAIGTDPEDSDSDGDGLPDAWELKYGLSPLRSDGRHGAAGDFDGDGISNLTEYQNGNDPSDGRVETGSNLGLEVYRPN